MTLQVSHHDVMGSEFVGSGLPKSSASFGKHGEPQESFREALLKSNPLKKNTFLGHPM